jgi:outer membrane protein TolC
MNIYERKGTYFRTLGVTYSSLFNADATTPIVTGIDSALYLGLNELTISPNWMIGAAMKWEVFTGFERKHKVHEAKINIEQLKIKLMTQKEKLQLLLENNCKLFCFESKKRNSIQQEKSGK